MCEVRVQCRKGNSDWNHHPDTLWRVASGPGADLGDPSETQRGAKNDPKNSIRRLFGTLGQPKNEKNGFGKRLEKT